MELNKITLAELKKIIKLLESDPDRATGSYIYRGYRLQISKFGSSGNERYMRLYRKRKENGLCIRCGKKVVKKNPNTGRLYRLCEHHREITDKNRNG